MFSLFIAAFFSTLVSAKSGGRLIAHSGSEQVAMIELFSSESCSSCPPADAWIGGLKSRPDLWKTFVPVVFHVDYWNYLDWKDGLSSREMTQRQIDLSKTWSKPSVYTPGVIVNGQEWRDWASRGLPLAKLNGNSIDLQLSENNPFEFQVQIVEKMGRKLRARVALLGFGLETTVSSGENSGKKLKHEFVVLDWSDQVWSQGQILNFKFKKPEQKYSRLAAVIWVEDQKNPIPLQVAGGYL